jgi:hypothetical protein
LSKNNLSHIARANGPSKAWLFYEFRSNLTALQKLKSPISIVTIMTYKHRYCYSIAFTTGLILLMKVHKYILPQHVMKIFGRLVLCWGMLWRWSQDWRDQQTKKLTRKTISVVGLQLHSLEAEEERRRRDKFMSILGNPSHPLYELWQMGSPFSH